MPDIRPINPKLLYLSNRAAPALAKRDRLDWDRIVSDWLNLMRSPNTKRAYQKDISQFLAHVPQLHDSTERSPNVLGVILSDRFFAYEVINRYRAELIKKELAPATINRKLSAIKSLAAYAYQCGHCEFTLEAIKLEKNRNYRDTSGIDAIAFKKLLDTCDSSLLGLRDFAILSLLWANALRRAEVCKCNVSDFDFELKSLRIFGKGRGNQSETIFLGESTRDAISLYLGMRSGFDVSAQPNGYGDDPLFVAHKAGYEGRRLSTNSIYNIVHNRGELAGISKKLSPHRIRHSAITTALDVTGGDVRRVQKLSRHSNLNTLMIYDDNRRNAQSEITSLLDGLV
jgi:integrase/recombinase XerC